MNDNIETEIDSEVDAAAAAMLSFKHGPIILNHNKGTYIWSDDKNLHFVNWTRKCPDIQCVLCLVFNICSLS